MPRYAPGRLASGEAALNHLFHNYRNNAKQSGIVWNLDKQVFRTLTKGNCFYCGAEPRRVWKGNPRQNGSYVYNGIDRQDNNVGYLDSNVVSCCSTCNYMKRTMTENGFVEHCRVVVEHWDTKSTK